MESPSKCPLSSIKQLYPCAPLRSCEDGITPVKPSLAHTEMGMAFRSFAGSKVTNLNLYRRTKVRRGHIAFPISPSPSPSFPNFVHAFPSGRIPLQLLRPGQHICCYSNWIKDWSRQRQQQQPVDPFSFSSANPDFSAFSCARICIFRVLRPENQTSFLTKTVKSALNKTEIKWGARQSRQKISQFVIFKRKKKKVDQQ